MNFGLCFLPGATTISSKLLLLTMNVICSPDAQLSNPSPVPPTSYPSPDLILNLARLDTHERASAQPRKEAL